jgi:hypothetical protein
MFDNSIDMERQYVSILEYNNYSGLYHEDVAFESRNSVALKSNQRRFDKRFVSTAKNQSNTILCQTSPSMADTKKEITPRRISAEGFILTAMLQEENFESGVANPSEDFFNVLLHKDSMGALNCVDEIFWTHLDACEKKRANVLIGILHMLSHCTYADVYPIGQTLAALALNHKEIEVCEFAVKCFENWANKDCVDKLKAMNIHSQWLKEYVYDVIAELEK